MVTAAELLERLNTGDECDEIEAKRTERDTSDAVLHTICAFANTPGLGGGYVLLGVSRTSTGTGDYQVTGVKNPDKIQNDIATQCATSFNLALRPSIRLEELGGLRVINIRVDELPPAKKPAFLKKLGLPRGAFLRVGPTDQCCTEDDYARLLHLRGPNSYDRLPVAGTSIKDVRDEAVDQYRRHRVKIARLVAKELAFSDSQLLRAVGALTDSGELTFAGLLLFGSDVSLRRNAPMVRIDYITIDGPEWTKRDERFTSVETLEPLMTAIPKVVAQVSADLPRVLSLKRNRIRRREIPVVPAAVLREAIVNAVMHRDYRTAEPIQIIRFSNRLEIRNAGASLKPDAALSEPGSVVRNVVLASILHDTGYAETKGTGIRTMQEEMRKSNLSPPIFGSDRRKDRFNVTLLTHHLLNTDAVHWLSRLSAVDLTEGEQRALLIVRETGVIDNAAYRSLNHVDVLEASNRLRHLCDLGLLEKHGRSAATFYVGSRRLAQERIGPVGPGRIGPPKPQERKRTDNRQKTNDNLSITPDEAELVQPLTMPASAAYLSYVLLVLCSRRPRTVKQLAAIVGRTRQSVGAHLNRLVEEGVVGKRFAGRHPHQEYRTLVALELLEPLNPDGSTRPRSPRRPPREAPFLPFD